MQADQRGSELLASVHRRMRSRIAAASDVFWGWSCKNSIPCIAAYRSIMGDRSLPIAPYLQSSST